MIATLERQLNIKELVFEQPVAPRRTRPEIDFSYGITWANTVLQSAPFLPDKFREAIDDLDKQAVIFDADIYMQTLKNKGTWQILITGNFEDQENALKLLLITKAEKARTESRDINAQEGQEIRKAIQIVAGDEGWEEWSDRLRTISEYPDVLVWIAEALAFQESTLSLPDYSSAEFQASDTPEVPVVRKF